MIICLGPICVPVHLLLAFLVGLAHQHGYMKWFKREWVMWSWWRQQIRSRFKADQEEAVTSAQACQPAGQAEGEPEGEATTKGAASGGSRDSGPCCTKAEGPGDVAHAVGGSSGSNGLRSRAAQASSGSA